MRPGKFKRNVLATTASGLILAMAACDTSGAGGSDEGQEITVLVSSGHLQFTPVWDRLDEFEEKTGITVRLDEVDTLDIDARLLRDVTAGSCTYSAVEMLDGGMAASAPHMADLGTFLEEDGSSVEELVSRHAKWTEEAMTFDGQLKYHPFYTGSKAIAYRKDLLEDPQKQAAFEREYGYDFPLPPETPEELTDLAEFFTGNGTDYGIVFSGVGDSGEGTLASLIFRHGVVGYQDEQGNALWGPEHSENQQAVADAASWIMSLVENGYAPRDVKAMSTDQTTPFYNNGNAAMIYDHIYLPWLEMTSENVTRKIGESGSFPVPNFRKGGSDITFYWGYGIPECSETKEAGWQFIKWLMSDKNLKLALTEGEGVFVPTDLDLLDWATQQNVVPEGVAQTVQNSKPFLATTAMARIRQNVHLPLVEQLMQGQLSPEEYAQQSGEAIQEEAEKSGTVG